MLLPLLTVTLAAAPAISSPLQSDAKAPPGAHVDVEIHPAARPAADVPPSAAPARASTESLATPRFPTPLHDVAEDGSAWVLGRAYKAHVASDAFTYVPFLGSSAPRAYPVRFALESVTLDGEPLAFDAQGVVSRAGDVLDVARGSLRERYVTRLDDVEQLFVFDRTPGTGEIVVTLTVTTDLAPSTADDGFRFENELGHVRYGHAAVVLGDGAPAPIESRFEDGRIRLVVPAELVARATDGLVIDPVVTTFAVADAVADEFAADTAFDVSQGIWLTVYESIFNAVDHDVVGQRHSTSGSLSGLAIVDATLADWRTPAVANNNVDDQFLVVAAVGAAPTRQIRARTVEATASLNMSASFRVDDPASTGDVYAPDVGGDPSTNGPTFYAVVWEREFIAGNDYDVLGRLVLTNATLGAGTIFIDNTAGTIHKNPAISNSCGVGAAADRDWNVVWEDEVTPTNHNVLGARVHRDGTITAGTFTIASSALDERHPSATCIVADSGGTRPWMVAYQMNDGADGWDVRCRTLNGTSIVSTYDLSDQFPSVALDQITPTCDTNEDVFVVAYEERTAPFFVTTDVKVSTLYSLGGALGLSEGDLSVSPGLFTDSRPRVVTRYAAGSSVDFALVVFDRDVGSHRDVEATQVDVPRGGPVTPICFGDGTGVACPCGNSGNAGRGCANSAMASGGGLSAAGEADVSDDTLVLTASGMPATAPVLFFQGTTLTGLGAGVVFGDGLRCTGGTVIRLAVRTASGGTASYGAGADPNVSVAGLVPAAGGLRYLQAWYRDSGNFCTPSTFNLTNALRVQWTP